MTEQRPPRILGRSSTAAIAAVRARAGRTRDIDRGRIERVLVSEGLNADVESLCASVFDRARVTLNFHPDRLIADGRTVAEALHDEGFYRSQFETGISSGGLTAHPGGDRDEWERRLFDGAYHAAALDPEQAAARPKYGGLNLAGFTNGPVPAFGSCALVLGRHETARTTFLFGDSCEHYEDIGTAEVFEPVLAALFERVAETGQMLGLAGISVRELVSRLSDHASPAHAFSRVLDDYIETHTHGPISLASGADALLLDPSFRGTPTATALLDAAERYDLSVSWHQGSELTLASFPTTTPVHRSRDANRWERFLLSGRAAELAARVIAEHALDASHLNAATIGAATHAFLRQPTRWQEWHAPDPSLTVFKDLWRILAAYGAPSV